MAVHLQPYPFKAIHHECCVPTSADLSGSTRYPVLVVGAGPVGLTLALSLAVHGIGCVVIDADHSVCVGSRAICISRRSLQIFQRLGVLDRFVSKGLPWTDGRSYFHGREVLHFRMPADTGEKLPPMLNIQQYYVEQFLLDEIAKYPRLVTMRWGTRAVSLRRDDAEAALTVRNDQDEYTLRGDWLVACDGGQSFVREALGLKLNGTSYEGRYVIADIALQSDLPTERLAWFDPPSNPGSTVLMHKQPDGIWRIDYQLNKSEDPVAAVQPEKVLHRIAEHLAYIGETGAWSPIWMTLYKAHALRLDRFRHGRVLFAGDAAHLLPIFGVRGANSGIDDADNLGWKLSCVIEGTASEQLLDNYSDERVYAATENLGYGRKSTEFMAPPTFAFDRMREAVLTLAVAHPEVRSLINPRQSASIRYERSTLNAPDSEEAAFSAGPPVGSVVAESLLHAGDEGGEARFLSELLGHQFTLLLFFADAADADEVARMRAELEQHRVSLRTLCLGRTQDNVALSLTYDARAGTAYLLRPDGHVLGRWRRLRASSIKSAIGRVLDLTGLAT